MPKTYPKLLNVSQYLENNNLFNESYLLRVPYNISKAIGLEYSLILQAIAEQVEWRGIYQNSKKWLRMNYDEMLYLMPFFSRYTLKKYIYELEKKQWILSHDNNKNPWDRTKWYRINYDLIRESLDIFNKKIPT